MIDTVVLLLPQHAYQITDPDKFVPSARWITGINSSAVHGIQSKQNPSKKELHAGIYKPRLTLFYRHHGEKQVMLKVELSLPKLFFGNNFQELKQKDLQPLLARLSSTLSQMGVIVDSSELAKAPVSVIHYSKNIPLTDGSTPYHYINKLKESNMKMSLDVNQTGYRNEGHSYKWHCNSYEIVFYDKIKDLEKAKLSDKRAIEKDNAIQLDLFPGFAKRKKKFEVLRMEVRLNKRQKIKQLFEKLGIKTDLNLKSLFKPAISKKVLLHYLDELESKRPPLLDYKAANDKGLLADLIFNNPDLSCKKIMQVYGLSKTMEIMNVRELRGIISKGNQKDWHRLMGEVKEVRLPGIQKPFVIIRDHIMKFKNLNLLIKNRGNMNKKEFNSGDKCYLFGKLPWNIELYNRLPIQIMDGVYLAATPFDALATPMNPRGVSMAENIAWGEWVAPGYHLKMGPAKLCILIEPHIEKNLRDKIFWSIVGSLYLIKPLYLHVSGSFIYGNNENDLITEPGKYDLRTNIFPTHPHDTLLSPFKYDLADIEKLKMLLPIFLSNYLSNNNSRQYFNVQIFLQAIIFERLFFKSSIYARVFPLIDSLTCNPTHNHASYVGMRLGNFLNGIPANKINTFFTKDEIKLRVQNIWSFHRSPELHGHLKEIEVQSLHTNMQAPKEIFSSDKDYKDLLDISEIARVAFLKTLLLEKASSQEYLEIPIPLTGKGPKENEVKLNNQERNQKAESFFNKPHKNDDLLIFYTDMQAI